MVGGRVKGTGHVFGFFCLLTTPLHSHNAEPFLPRGEAVKDAHLRAREGLSLTASSTVGR